VRVKGTITSWHDDKGYGFIKPIDGSADVFVHITAFRNLSRRPATGTIVSYALTRDKQGRPRATSATLAGDRLPVRKRQETSRLPIALALGFLAFAGGAVFATGLPWIVSAAYLAASTASYLVYWLDKAAARADGRRIPESTLHLLALVGGWPGALLAQQQYRHKTRKPEFRIVFWFTVLGNIAAFVYLMTPTGGTALSEFIASFD
jgi:uncharacterized membrane protein YsdA (DUF1294 family)/cold shock CspA family protein